MSNRDQHELSELYKAMTRADADRKKRIEDAKALAVFFFACWVLIGLCALIVTRC
jgi:hypothetical protein